MVFLDLEMPIMNGFSCSAAFREWERRTRVGALRQPICALSVHTGKQEKDMCAEAGVDFFEAKPARIPGPFSPVSVLRAPLSPSDLTVSFDPFHDSQG